MKISNLADVYTALMDLAYPATLSPEAVLSRVGKFPVIVTINNKSEVVISCQIASLGVVAEENLAQFAFVALDANTRLSPFAIALITEDDGLEALGGDEGMDYPIVLVDNIPLGDLCTDELKKAFESLHAAIIGCRDVLQAGINSCSTATAEAALA